MIALVQRKRRKAHIASRRPGAAEWLSVCDLYIAGDADWHRLDLAMQIAEQDPDRICRHCQRVILMADLIATYRTGVRAA